MKPIKKELTSPRRKFDETFKREAVHNWLSSGKSATVIGQELGLHPNEDTAQASVNRIWRDEVLRVRQGNPHKSRSAPKTSALLLEPIHQQGVLNRKMRPICGFSGV